MPNERTRIESALDAVAEILGLTDEQCERIGFARGEIMLPVDLAERLIALAKSVDTRTAQPRPRP